ncbi:MAG TPA: N-acetylglucosamine-6-phosphate deacetylase [bacterium]|nr:N-acetylglucosamine-6-phosphate deacetylase [bacterium]
MRLLFVPGSVRNVRGVNTREWIVDRAVLPHAIQAGTRIAAVDGRVVAVDQVPTGPGAERLRGTLLPGFVDLQVNGAGGRSVDEATPEALDVVAEAVLAGGAVAFLPTLITCPWERLLQQVRDVAAWIGAWSGRGAEPLGLHVEGPFLTTPGAHDPSCLIDPTPERIDELLAAADGRLRLVTLANARDGAVDATRRLVAAGVTVALGHCDSADGFASCVAAGATMVTHLFNAMGRLHHRDAGPAALALDDERLSCPLIVDGVHVGAPMVRTAFRVLGPDRTVLVTDAVGAAGMPDGDYTLSGMQVTSRDGVVRDAAGNLAGSALTMALAARNFLAFVAEAGPWTLARVAAHNPARLIGADTYGALAPDRRAAFTLLGDDGSITCVR